MSNHRALHSCDLASAGVDFAVENGAYVGRGHLGGAPNRKLAVLFLPQILFVTLLSITCLSSLMALDRS